MEAPSTPPPNRPRMTYDVFISFRGETRNNFVGFLYEALRQLGIMTFMDDKKLLIGDDLSEKLVKAIEESRSSIVVLSKDYASSKWCLKELAKIMGCMAEKTHRVLPVFFYVDPSHVRHQSGNFEKSFDEHEAKAQKLTGEQKENYLKEVQNWKDSMTKIGNLDGEVVTRNSSEVDVVKKITNQIFERWRPKIVTSDKNLVGMTYQLLKLNVQLGLGLDDVRFVGIVGMGGIGKTTIAEVVYDCITSKFEGICFLRVFGGSSKQSNLVSLQEQLLSRLFLKENVRIWDEDYGAEMIQNQLCSRKVLLVLDGLEEKKQLEMLAGSPNWFGPGSRIIITTRNKEILRQPYKILEYNVELLDDQSAIQLFCNRAFGKDYIDSDFVNISMEIIEKLGRLPLALKIIGSHLYKRDKVIWKETSNRLMKVDENSLLKVLKISYDGLGVESQKVFLDLTCLLHGKKNDQVIELLECFGYRPNSELLLLRERCLLEASSTNILMHDLVVALGQEIVYGESFTQPGKQSRIWLHTDVRRIFEMKHGLKYTEGIVSMKNKKNIRLDAESFTDMTCLRILEISDVQLSGNINFLSNLLGLLNWPGYPSKCLPSNFQSGCLIELHLPLSSIERLWEGKKDFEKLKVIDVSDSELLETPDFSKVPNLERLILHNCRKLYHIHSSINDLNRLILLDLSKCSSLESFSSYLRCKSLESLILFESGLTSFPEFDVNMEHLRELYLGGTQLKQLHSSIRCLIGLVVLDLSDCIMLSSLPSEIGNLKSLEFLHLDGCKILEQIPPSLGNAQCLEVLGIGKTSICRVPPTIHCLKNLKSLNCEGLSCNIWHSLFPPGNIPRSDVEISSLSFGLKSLEYLNLKDCNLRDEDIPEDLHYFSSLTSLDLSGNHFVQLPNSINHLVNLNTLALDNCFKLQQIPRLSINMASIFTSSESGMPIRGPPCQQDQSFRLQLVSYMNAELYPSNAEGFMRGSICTFTYDMTEDMEFFDVIREGNSVQFEYNEGKDDVNVIYGVFLGACIQFSKNTSHDEDNKFYSSFLVELTGHMYPMLSLSYAVELTSRAKFFGAFITSRRLSQSTSMKKPRHFEATIKCAMSSVDIQMCSASVLSPLNAAEFMANLFKRMFGDHDTFKISLQYIHRSECSCDEPETVEHNSLTQSVENECESSSLLRRNLKSILWRTYEDAKRVSPSYYFPQNQVPSWFRMQQLNGTVKIKLPPNLFREKKWMGFAVFAIFSVQRNSEFVQNHPFILEIGSYVTRTSYGFKAFFMIPPQLLRSSPETKILFVVFRPRRAFHFLPDKSNHLYVKFFTRLQVELCGARLVYQHNIEGLIDTIVDGVINSGQNEEYPNYSEQILKELLATCREQPIWSKVTEDQPITSTSNDPSHPPFKNIFPVRPPFKNSNQDRFKSMFNAIIHRNEIPGFSVDTSMRNKGTIRMPEIIIDRNEIPGFFVGRSMGNVVTIRMPEKLDFGESLGFLVCAVLTIKHKPESGIKVCELKCEFEVDSNVVEPVHCFFVPAKKLLSQSMTPFVWLFFIPLAAFDFPLILCNYLRSKVSSSDEELIDVQQCGLHLLHATEIKMLYDYSSCRCIFHANNNHKLTKGT